MGRTYFTKIEAHPKNSAKTKMLVQRFLASSYGVSDILSFLQSPNIIHTGISVNG